MSIVAADLLTNVAGTGSPNIQGGELSRARWNFNGTGTIANRDSFNVSSLVDNGTGDYTVNFSTAFPNSDLVIVGSVAIGTEIGTSSVRNLVFVAMTTANVRNICLSQSNVATDYNFVLANVFGDKP